MSTNAPSAPASGHEISGRIAVVAARFNEQIVSELLSGCLRRLAELDISVDRIQVERVPGAFELPLAAKALSKLQDVVAVICLGAVIRGETPHFEYVAGECARGIAEISREQMVPIIFGVLTTNTQQQAHDRIGGVHGHAGERAAEAAVEMATLLARLRTNVKQEGQPGEP